MRGCLTQITEQRVYGYGCLLVSWFLLLASRLNAVLKCTNGPMSPHARCHCQDQLRMEMDPGACMEAQAGEDGEISGGWLTGVT